MINYIRSELYRAVRTRKLYYFTGVLMVLSLILHVSIYFFSPRYATTSFSYSNLVANPMIFGVMGICIVYLLYEDSRQNGNLKNTVAFGIGRGAIFIGECITALAVAVISMVLVLAVWIAGAVCLLEPAGPVALKDLLLEIPAVFLIASAAVASGILCIGFFEKSFTGLAACICFWLILPKAVFYLGLKNKVFYQISLLFPDNLFYINKNNVDMSTCLTAWDTPEGMADCILVGALWLAVFTVGGVLILKKRDLC